MAVGYCVPVRARADQTFEQYGLQLIAYLLEHGSPVASGFDDRQLEIARGAVGYAVQLKYPSPVVYARLGAIADALTALAAIRAQLDTSPAPQPPVLIERLPSDQRRDQGPMAWLNGPRQPQPQGPSGAPAAVRPGSDDDDWLDMLATRRAVDVQF